MNAYVCSVKFYLEVSRRGYLVTRDKHIRLYLEVGLETPKKKTETRGESLWKKLHFKLGLDL